jgi:hypothetical protein
MSPESSGPTELHEARWPGDDGWHHKTAAGRHPGWPDDQTTDDRDPGWPDDETTGERDPDWPDDQTTDERDPDWPDDWPDDDRDVPAWRRAAPPAAYGSDRGPRRRGLRPLALAAVAVVALGGGAGVALAITRGLDNSGSPSATSSTPPPQTVPGGNGGTGGGTVPGGGGQVGEAFLVGTVQAVSSTSITIGGPGQSMTAAITSATKITGKVTSIGGIKVGDQVSAQITESNGHATVTALQYPAQTPSGGGLP